MTVSCSGGAACLFNYEYREKMRECTRKVSQYGEHLCFVLLLINKIEATFIFTMH